MSSDRKPYPLPSVAERVRLAGDEHQLLVVVDTEEEFDWSAGFDRRNTGVEHMRSIDLLQDVFDENGIVPIYVVDQPIADHTTSAEPLRRFHADGRCEIGAHLHPWVTPPFDEEVNSRNSYPGNLPPGLERAKLETLVRSIENGLGVHPRAYKAGRYGAGPNTAEVLEDLGFEIDLSPCPPFDYGYDGGPDWTLYPCEPFWIGPRKNVLSIPNTGAFLGFVKDGAHVLYRLASVRALRFAHLPGILARTHAVERLYLSPEGNSFNDLRRLTLTLSHRGLRTFTFSLHSPSVLPGCTPYVRTAADRTKFLDACRRYFQFFREELGGTSITTTELRARAVAVGTD